MLMSTLILCYKRSSFDLVRAQRGADKKDPPMNRTPKIHSMGNGSFSPPGNYNLKPATLFSKNGRNSMKTKEGRHF
jgi:hypothetical protein